MKTILTVLIILALNAPLFAVNPLSGLTEDERLHGLLSFGITEITKHHFNFEWWQSLLFIGAIGAFKEVIIDNQYDYKDINANFAGCFISLSFDLIGGK